MKIKNYDKAVLNEWNGKMEAIMGVVCSFLSAEQRDKTTFPHLFLIIEPLFVIHTTFSRFLFHHVA
jgi:hypothetical protein